MTEHEFKEKVTKLAESIVNTIADKEYAKLASIVQMDLSWADGEKTLENACLGFGQWLDEQLAMWAEDEDRKFVIDHFNEECLEDIEIEDDNTSFVSYNPTNSGEEMDLWFEMDFKVEEDGQITVKFEVNI